MAWYVLKYIARLLKTREFPCTFLLSEETFGNEESDVGIKANGETTDIGE